MLAAFFQSIAVKWVIRRILELGGFAVSIGSIIAALPPSSQKALGDLVTGKLDQVSVLAAFGLVSAIGSYVWSFHSTTKRQVVVDGVQQPVPKSEVPAARDLAADAKRKKKTLAEQLGGLFAGRK